MCGYLDDDKMSYYSLVILQVLIVQMKGYAEWEIAHCQDRQSKQLFGVP